MKTTKRVLSLLIVVVMLFASLSLVSVSAEDKQFTLTLNTTCEVISGAYDPAHLDFTAPEDGLYRFYSTSSLDTSASLYNEEGYEIAFNDDGMYGCNFGLCAYLEEGQTYTLQTYYYFTEDLNAYCVNVEKVTADIITTTISSENIGIIQYTPDTDGYYSFYTTSDNYISFHVHDENDSYLYGEGKCFLNKGQEYTVEVKSWSDSSEEIMIVIEESVYAVEASVVSEPNKKTIVKGFIEDSFTRDGLEVEFTMSDGTIYTWTEGLVNGSNVQHDLDIPNEKSAKSTTQSIAYEITCDDAYACVYYDLIENPIASVEYLGDPIICYENTCGFYNYDFDDNEYFVYEYSLPESHSIKLNYTDGTSETYSYFDDNTPYRIRIRDNQEQNHWTKDSDNATHISCLGKTTDIPVQILECPIESITVNKAPDYVYSYGDSTFGWLELEEGEYTFTPNQFLGINMTVKYKDGTSEVVTEDTFVDLPYNHYCFNEISVYGACTTKAELIFKGFKVEYDIVVKDYSSGPASIIGDANRDEEINIKDATLIQKSLALLEELSSTGETLADVDNDYEITIKDATAIQKHIAGIDTGYPIGEYIY